MLYYSELVRKVGSGKIRLDPEWLKRYVSEGDTVMLISVGDFAVIIPEKSKLAKNKELLIEVKKALIELAR